MKKSNILIILVFALIVLVVIGSGVLELKQTRDNEKIIVMDSIEIYNDDENVIADIGVALDSTYNRSVDHQNISVKISGTTVNVIVPTSKSDSTEIKDYERVSVVLGSKDKFKDDLEYKFIFNKKNKDEAFYFKFKDGMSSIEYHFYGDLPDWDVYEIEIEGRKVGYFEKRSIIKALEKEFAAD